MTSGERSKMRMTTYRSRAIAAGLFAATLAWSSALAAQQPSGSTRSYTVKAGDTLWELARQHLNDPFLWPEIYRANSALIDDPHWLSPGRVIQLPVRAAQAPAQGAPDAAPTPPAVRAPEDQQPSARLAPVGSSSRTLQMSPSDRAAGTTIFANRVRASAPVASLGGGAGEGPSRVVRPGEFYAAPWLEKKGGPVGMGRLVASSEMAGIAQAGERGRLQSQERAYITLPTGVQAKPGDQFIAVGFGPVLDDGRQVVIPTAVLQVEKTSASEATTVRVIAHFEDVMIGQGVVPAERFDVPVDVRPGAVADGVVTKIISVPARSVLPSLQRYVILEAGQAKGVKVGDQYTLIRPREKMESGVVLPEHQIARVQVVRVTAQGSSAIIVDQIEPVIREGVLARLTAKMP